MTPLKVEQGPAHGGRPGVGGREATAGLCEPEPRACVPASEDPSGFSVGDEQREQDWTDGKARLSQWQWALFLLSLFIKMVALG